MTPPPAPTPEAELAALQAQGLLRELRPLPAAGGRIALDGGGELLNFSSNDYLNLAGDARLKGAAAAAVARLGCGATASRLMTGTLDLHGELEGALARLTGMPCALVFGSGFLANLGLLTALAGARDAIFADRLNHASLVDGARMSGARLHRYRHADAAHLGELLERSAKHEPAERRIVVTDSIFSMDGDAAPLEAIAALAKRHGALLVVDEAHAIGVNGGGGGLCRALPPEARPDFVVGTLSKALGSYGGFVATSPQWRDWLINRARPFIYSTALPPACLAAALAAIGIIEAEPGMGEELLGRARRLAALLAERGIAVPGSIVSPILPVKVGDNHRALALAEALRGRGVLAVAVRPPTVPEGTARLRLSVTLAHGEADLRAAADAVADALAETGAPCHG
jgi:8-amino-7-oxononanoate synthase